MGILEKPSILKKLSDIDTSLGDIATKHKNIVYLEDFEGKANDNTVDNSTPFINAINSLISAGGGILQLLSGTYEFKTAITINVPFSAIKVKGVGIHNGTYGTKINWSGTGYFLTLNQGGQYYEIKDFYIKCNSNYGFLLNKGTQTHFKSRLKDIFIMDALRSVDLKDFAYYFMENIIIGTNDANTERGILIDSQGVSEFLYVEKCSIDGYSSCNANGVIVNNGSKVSINDCDICNFGTGIGLLIETSSSSSIQAISIRDLNMIRCDGGLQLKATNASITQVLVDNPIIVFRGLSNTEVGIKTSRSVDYVTSGLRLRSLNFRKIGDTSPSNVVYVGDNTIGDSFVEVNSNLTAGTCYIGASGYPNYYYDPSISFFERVFDFTGDGSTTTFECILSSNSPFGGNAPCIVANSSLTIPFAIVLTGNAIGGNLFAHITFATPPANGVTFKVYTTCGHKIIT